MCGSETDSSDEVASIFEGKNRNSIISATIIMEEEDKKERERRKR